MRGRGSVVVLALVALLASAGSASADPSDVYVDYATDGTIECTHSRGDLEGILTDASINEYGDPLTLTRLRIAVRRQLAAGCVRGGTAPAAATTPGGEEAAPDPAPTTSADDGPSEGQGAESTTSPTATGAETAATTATEPADGETAPASTPAATTADPGPTTVAAGPAAATDDGGGTSAALVGGGVLAIGLLAAGGWLARRSLTRSP